MNLKICLYLMLALSANLFGCSTGTDPSNAGVQKNIDIPYERINGFPYETKPVWLASRGLFYWFVSSDLKSIHYEPCCGEYEIETLRHTSSELTFTVIRSGGFPIDLRNGSRIAASDVVGKKYRAKLEGDHIVRVSQLN